MERSLLIAVFVALLTGLAIGAQGGVVRSAAALVGAARAGMLVNVAGGTLSILLLAALAAARGHLGLPAVLHSAPFWGGAGALGVGILVGMAVALPRLGIAAGLGGIIFGQMLAAVLIDTAGLGGTRIALSAPRLAGLAFLALGIVLLLPRR